MHALVEKYNKKDLTILAISLLNDKRATKNYIKNIFGNKSAPFTVLYGRSKVQKDFGGEGIPNTFIIDKQGQIRYKHNGFTPGLGKTFELEINSLLDGI